MRALWIAVVIVAVILISVVFILSPSEKIGGWGVYTSSGHVVRVTSEESDFQVIVRDLEEGKEWTGYWKIEAVPENGPLELFASTKKTNTILGVRIPAGTRELRVGFSEGRDIHGSSDGFSYDVLWRKKKG